MLRKITFKNFYSFEKEQEINFTAHKKNTYDYYNSPNNDQISKVVGFVGSNASGKTNIMRLLSFLSYFVCRNTDETTGIIPNLSYSYKTFFNNKEAAKFSIEYEKNNTIFFYNFSIKENIILSESLSIKKLGGRSRKNKVFQREKSSLKILNKNFFNKISIKSLPNIREDVSLITFIKKSTYSVEIINTVYDYFSNFKTNINERGEINNAAHRVLTLKQYDNTPNLKQNVNNFIANFNIGIKGFKIDKKTENGRELFFINGIHTTKHEDKYLDISCESSGTQALFFTAPNLLTAIKNDNVIIIDELESGLHPEAVDKLICYFIEENKNKKSQLIFLRILLVL